jgi:hypothetical protein
MVPKHPKKEKNPPHRARAAKEQFFCSWECSGNTPKMGRECVFYKGSVLLKNSPRREHLGSTLPRSLPERLLWERVLGAWLGVLPYRIGLDALESPSLKDYLVATCDKLLVYFHFVVYMKCTFLSKHCVLADLFSVDVLMVIE